MVAETELATTKEFMQNGDYVYVRVRREKPEPVDNGLTDTMQTRFPKALGHKMQHQFFTPFQCICRQPHYSSDVYIPVPFVFARVSVVQPGGCGDTSVNFVQKDPHLEALTQHFAERLAVPGASAVAEAKVLMDSGSGLHHCRRSS